MQNGEFREKNDAPHMPSASAFSPGRFYVAEGAAISDVKLLVQEFNFTFNFKERAQPPLTERIVKR